MRAQGGPRSFDGSEPSHDWGRTRPVVLHQLCAAFPVLHTKLNLTLTLFGRRPVGVSAHVTTGYAVWRIPFGFQLVPAGLMSIGLLTVKESPRWLASVGHIDRAFANLAYLRRLPIDDSRIRAEMAEIEAAMAEEREARKGMGGIQGVREAFLGKGNGVRFVIAIVIFVLQNWNGQNSVGYYAPQIFSQVSFAFLPSSHPRQSSRSYVVYSASC